MDEKMFIEAMRQMMAEQSKQMADMMDAKLAPIREDLKALKADNAKLVTLEKKADLLLEGQQGMNEKFAKLDSVAEDVEDIKLTVRAMEAVTQRNSKDIQNLRAVK
ncbi:MAG: hypothetical protein KHX46_00660 [Clostridiales bacterium]|nr:hypothetical protein [Clostridiales bacterium]